MPTEHDAEYFAMQAHQELELAALAENADVKARHLNTAAKYATLRELSVTPHKPD